MKILEINKFNFSKGGADRHFLDVCELLEKNGNEIAIFSMDHPKNEDSIWKDYFVSYVGYNKNDSNFWQKMIGLGRFFYSFSAKKKIKKLLDDFQPDVVHIHNIYHQISFSILKEIKKRNIPIVATVHDFAWISPDRNEYLEKVGKNFWKFTIFGKKYSFLKRVILALKSYWEDICGYKNYVDFFISPSQFLKNIFVSSGILEKKIIVLPHFILSDLSENLEKIDEQYAFYFGRISKEKGVPEMIEVFQKLKIKLYLAGEIEDGTKIPNNNFVKYLGFLGKKEIANYVKNAMFCVSFSHLPETFGLIALESISAGKPFLGFNTGAYSEIIKNEKNGFIVDKNEKMMYNILNIKNGKIIFNEEEIKLQAEKYSANEYYAKLRSIFEDVLESSLS